MGVSIPICTMNILNWHAEESAQGRYRQRYLDNMPLIDSDHGKAKVDCCLKQDEFQWGSLNGREAVIMHLFTDLSQEKDYRFERCVIRLSFTRSDPTPMLSSHESVSVVSEAPRLPQPPVPAHLKGADSVQHRSNEATGYLNIGAGPAAMGASLSRSSEHEIRGSWRYISHWGRGQDGDYQQYYTQASWHWETERHSQNDDVSRLYSGLILNHFSNPFRISCSIEAKIFRPLRPISVFKRYKGHNKTPKIIIMRIPEQLPCINLADAAEGLEDQIKAKMYRGTATVMSAKEYTAVSTIVN